MSSNAKAVMTIDKMDAKDDHSEEGQSRTVRSGLTKSSAVDTLAMHGTPTADVEYQASGEGQVTTGDDALAVMPDQLDENQGHA